MDELIMRFLDHYLSKEEVAWRLPAQIPITAFWPSLLTARREASIFLPLLDQQGIPFWFVLNKTIEEQCDHVSAAARRRNLVHSLPSSMMYEALIDEAFWSSVLEGALLSREQAAKMIQKGVSPKNKSEQMVQNNYYAVKYALEHLDDPITKETLIDIAQIVTQGASDETVCEYRTEPVYVVGKDKIVYTPPAADHVPVLMEQLLQFVDKSELHPILKTCIAHFYFVYVHPFSDGNGRTARVVSYMMLLKTGYDIFRYFSISSIIAKERNRYYKSMVQVENASNGPADMTYFIDFYSAMLERCILKMEHQLSHHLLAEQAFTKLQDSEGVNERRIKGTKWLLEGDHDKITVEVWKKKFSISTETARQDLLWLSNAGVLERAQEGKKASFVICRNISWDVET